MSSLTKIRGGGLTLALSLCLAGSLVAQQDQGSSLSPEATALSKVLVPSLERIAPSVVTVETFGGIRKAPKTGSSKKPKRPKPKPKPSGKKKKPKLGPLRFPGFLQAQGVSTGLVLSEDGWILTSEFALNYDPTTILVTLADGRKFTAKAAGKDYTRGLALLKIDADGLKVPEFVKPEKLSVGQWVFALGRSFGPKRPTVHMGILSALRRISGRAVQCDANTSPANYGGPLIDVQGRVIGLIAPLSPQGGSAGANWYDSGIGFAATLGGIAEILDGMKKGKVYRPSILGINFDPRDLGPGAKLLSVKKKTAAHQAGLKKGDKILSVDGVKVRHAMHLQELIKSHVAGDWTLLEVEKKDGNRLRVLVQLDAA